jgi:hypothetical protein
MLHEYHFIFSVRYYPRFHITALGLGGYGGTTILLLLKFIIPSIFCSNEKCNLEKQILRKSVLGCVQ